VKAIILSAGQGSRLLPLTARTPKCLLPLHDQNPAVGLQLRAIAAAGIEEACVVVGFGAQQVEAHLRQNPIQGLHVETLYNPFYAVADNLISCWVARSQMQSDFVLMNGDTLFAPSVLTRLLAAPWAPITLAINHKDEYDADDMKVELAPSGRLEAVAKSLKPEQTNAESIGMMCFRGKGPEFFRDTLDDMVRSPEGLHSYYLAAINRIAARGWVRGAPIDGDWWAEIDTVSDLMQVRTALSRCAPVERVPKHETALLARSA
jgi:choline kinase